MLLVNCAPLPLAAVMEGPVVNVARARGKHR